MEANARGFLLMSVGFDLFSFVFQTVWVAGIIREYSEWLDQFGLRPSYLFGVVDAYLERWIANFAFYGVCESQLLGNLLGRPWCSYLLSLTMLDCRSLGNPLRSLTFAIINVIFIVFVISFSQRVEGPTVNPVISPKPSDSLRLCPGSILIGLSIIHGNEPPPLVSGSLNCKRVLIWICFRFRGHEWLWPFRWRCGRVLTSVVLF